MTRRRTLLALAGLVALAAVGGAAFLRSSEPPTPASPPLAEPAPAEPASTPDPAPLPERVTVRALEGRVEVRRGGESSWQPATAGLVLDADDAIRTGSTGTVDLVAAGRIVHLVPGTDVQVKELATDLYRFLLGAGMVTAESRGDGAAPAPLQIEVAGTDVAARTDAGRFSMSSNGRGTVAVASAEGDVHVTARGREVVLRPGRETLVRPGAAPSDPRPVASSLLLKVAWPTKRELNRPEVTLAGRTRAGALVFVAGRPVPVDAAGRFEAHVTLREGRNNVPVKAMDVAGHASARRSPRIVVDTRGAKARFDTDDLWGE